MRVFLAGLTMVVGLALLACGAVLGAADGVLREHGFITSDPVVVSTPGYAVVITDGLHVDGGTIGALSERTVGTVRVTATGADHTLFVGVADSRNVRGYLAGVRRATVTELSGPDGTPTYRDISGGSPAAPPADLPFWLSSSRGTGGHTVTTDIAADHWSIVVMNNDGSPGVTADLRVGATMPMLGRLATGSVVAGAILLAGGAVAWRTALAGHRKGPRSWPHGTMITTPPASAVLR